MKDLFLTNASEEFLDKLKSNLKKCKNFTFSVSFIKLAGLCLFERELEEALARGVTGKIITSTYQNFTDVPSLEHFLTLQNKYDNFECHIDFNCFGSNGFHTKGYLFEYEDSYEFIVGSTNITRYAFKKNEEWNVSLVSKDKMKSYGEALNRFNYLWKNTLKLNSQVIKDYKYQLEYAIERWDMDYISISDVIINPNSMQRKALRELRRNRDMGVKRSLIVSATGSGKTYLAAFDARNFDAKRLLYVVHRETILKDARDSFMKVFGAEKTYGLYTGNEKNLDVDFLFASNRMLSQHLDEFDPEEFDYIIFDEVHHIVASSGKKILAYFKPEFMLGLTATPERMDNQDIFSIFDNNVPFELRLRDAISNDLVVPFHYYGIRDQFVDYKSKDKMYVANQIAKQVNVEFIKDQIEKHRKANEKLKCIAFCTNIQSTKLMAEELLEEGYQTICLTGINDTAMRMKAFNDLQDETNSLEIICTVDILNEGVDIPGINMVLFLRPTESQTIFIQQLGRGLRKYPGKEYVTVLDFIGNNYDRAVQIALALGALGKTTYMEKTYLKQMIRTNFKSLDIPNVVIDIDDLSKEEIINFIDKTNFNNVQFLKKDYQNFKEYINNGSYPTHLDFLNSDVAPDFMRILKSSLKGSKNKSYYNFLKKIEEENIPYFNDSELSIINKIEDMLPIARLDEYLIIEQLLDDEKIDLKKVEGINDKITKKSLANAYQNLIGLGLVDKQGNRLFNVNNEELIIYLRDVINYGIIRYNREFGDYEGMFKLYANYYKQQASRIMLKNGILQKGTYYEDEIAYVFAGIKKDDEGKLNYKDKFINNKVFQWESIADVSESEKQHLRNSKKVHLFIRKMENEDTVTLPYTYFGLGEFTNERISHTEENGVKHPTLLYDIVLDKEVPEEYYIDFEIPEKADE